MKTQNFTVQIFVPEDKMIDFNNLIEGQDIYVPIYSEKMISPVCFAVNVSYYDFQLIKHLILL